jgi:hypothetical protein
MDSLKFHPGWPLLKRSYATVVSGVVHLQGRGPAVVFYPFRHPTPDAYTAKWNVHLVEFGGPPARPPVAERHLDLALRGA